MNELSPEAKELLTIASGADDPSADDKARVRRALMAAVAAGAVTGVAAAAGASGAAAGSMGSSAGAAGAAATAAGSAGAASVGAASVGAGAVGGGAVLGSTLGAKVLALVVAVGAGTTVVVTKPWSEEPRVEETRAEQRRTSSSALAEGTPTRASAPEASDLAGEAVVAPDETIDTIEAPSEVAEAPVDATEASRASPSERPTRRPRESVSAAVAPDTLAAELALLRRARAALATNDLAEATRALDEHAASFAEGALRSEREGTRALVRCAERADPEVARAFVSRHPGSPLAARVRAACGAD